MVEPAAGGAGHAGSPGSCRPLDPVGLKYVPRFRLPPAGRTKGGFRGTSTPAWTSAVIMGSGTTGLGVTGFIIPSSISRLPACAGQAMYLSSPGPCRQPLKIRDPAQPTSIRPIRIDLATSPIMPATGARPPAQGMRRQFHNVTQKATITKAFRSPCATPLMPGHRSGG